MIVQLAALSLAAAIPLAGRDAAAVRTPSSAEAWGGVRDGQPTLSDRVVRYQIKARLDPKKHTIDGREQLTWRNRSSVPVSEVYLHLYLNGFESTGSTFMREKGAGGFRGLGEDEVKKGEWGYAELRSVKQDGKSVAHRFVHPDGGPETDHTVVELQLPQPVPPGGSTTLDIDFFDQLPRVVARTGYFNNYHLVGQWYPKIGVLELPGERGATAPRWNCHEFHLHSEFYADFGSFDVEMTVPKGYLVGSTGERQGEPRETADGVVHRYTQDDVHDFAWVATDNFAPPLTAEWTHAGSPKVTVSVLYPAEYQATAQPALQATLDALTFFSDTLGPYPYKTATAVLPPYNAEESGGMEYPTFFTSLGGREYHRELPVVDFVTVHEFGHGYFYGILASNEFEEPYLDEGQNDLWDLRMMDRRGDSVSLSRPWLERLGVHLPKLSLWDFERLSGAVRESADPLAANAWHRYDNYGNVYQVTATWFEDLERRIGTEAFAKGYKEYYRRWKFRHPSTADLEQALAEGTGQADIVHAFFADHVYRGGPLDDRIMLFESDEARPELGYAGEAGQRKEREPDEARKEVEAAREAWRKAHPDAKDKKGVGPYPYRTTVTARRHKTTDTPQELLLKFADGSEQRFAWAPGETWHKWELTTPSRAVSAQLDPDRKHYADFIKLDDGHTLESDGLPARRWSLEAAAWVQMALALVEAL